MSTEKFFGEIKDTFPLLTYTDISKDLEFLQIRDVLEHINTAAARSHLIEQLAAITAKYLHSTSVEMKSLIDLGVLEYVKDYEWSDEFYRKLASAQSTSD